jgi:hypothetical protein
VLSRPQNTGQTKLSDSFVGKVVEVVSGDTLVVTDANGGGGERRISLSRWGRGVMGGGSGRPEHCWLSERDVPSDPPQCSQAGTTTTTTPH